MDWDWTQVIPDGPDKIPIGFRLFCDTVLEVPEEFKPLFIRTNTRLSAEQ